MVVATLPANPGKVSTCSLRSSHYLTSTLQQEELLGELIKEVQKRALSDEEPGTVCSFCDREVAVMLTPGHSLLTE